MRRIERSNCPEILANNEKTWLAAYKADPENSTKKYKYRHADIKDAIKADAKNKCMFCESKIGHNTPGDVEHFAPTSEVIDLHFSWFNLGLCCNECNRRKGTYYEPTCMFLNPYSDAVDDRVLHFGPVMGWAPGDAEAEVSIRELKLNSDERIALIIRKTIALQSLSELIGRLTAETREPLRRVLLMRLDEMKNENSEYSGMLREAAQRMGY